MAEIIKIQNNQRELEAGLRRISKWKIPVGTRSEFIRFIEELSLGKVNKGKRISEAAQLKYVNTLKVSLEFFSKPTRQISGKDVEEFEKALSSDRIKSNLKGTPYSHSSKVSFRKALKIYLRWRLGQAKAHQLAGWLDTRDREKTPEYLNEHEVEKLFSACRTAEQRFVVAVLFDSGARAEEFMNIRFEDVHLPEGRQNFPKITLREEYSKTKGRTISLYWKHSLQAVREYMAERIEEPLKPQEPIFKSTYGAMRMFLRRIGIAVLKKGIHPHLFRHSSATHYAGKLNRQELCYRYGWKFSSKMPDVYISRAGMENKELDEKFDNAEINVLKDELERSQLDLNIKNDRILQLERKMLAVEERFHEIAKAMAMRPTTAQVEAALSRKRKAMAA